MPGTSTKSFSPTLDRRGKLLDQSLVGANWESSVMAVMSLTCVMIGIRSTSRVSLVRRS